MQVEIEREQLSQAVSRVSRIIALRPALPMLANILLTQSEQSLELFATDLELGIVTTIPLTKDTPHDTSQLVIPARPLFEFLATNTDQRITLTSNGPGLRLESEHMKAEISGVELGEFPTPPTDTPKYQITVKKIDFIQALRQVGIAPAAQDTRPVLTGMLVVVREAILTLVATDSFRLAEKHLTITAPESVLPSIIIPGRTASELLRLAGTDSHGDVEFRFDEHQCQFLVGGTRLVSRLIDGSFPAYQGIIPQAFQTEAHLKRAELLSLVKAANVFSRESGSSIKMNFSTDGFIQVRSGQGQFGQVETRMEAEVTGESIEIAFNARFVLDVLNVLSGQDIVFRLNGKTTPALVTTPDDPNYRYVMTPLRIEG